MPEYVVAQAPARAQRPRPRREGQPGPRPRPRLQEGHRRPAREPGLRGHPRPRSASAPWSPTTTRTCPARRGCAPGPTCPSSSPSPSRPRSSRAHDAAIVVTDHSAVDYELVAAPRAARGRHPRRLPGAAGERGQGVNRGPTPRSGLVAVTGTRIRRPLRGSSIAPQRRRPPTRAAPHRRGPERRRDRTSPSGSPPRASGCRRAYHARPSRAGPTLRASARDAPRTGSPQRFEPAADRGPRSGSRRGASTSTSASTAARASRRVLAESHLVIGRVPGVQLLLDHHTVSRRHAEMFCDPFGRWWIRDLGSTNGTLVNDEPVRRAGARSPATASRSATTPSRSASRPTTAARAAAATPSPYEDEQPTAIRTLLDFEPPRIAAEHLRTLLEFSRRLIAIESPDERLDALCQLMVRSDFHGTAAVVLRLEPTAPPRRSRRTTIPRPRAPRRRSPTSRGASSPRCARRASPSSPATSTPRLAAARSSSSRISREVMALWVVACPLRTGGRTRCDVLYVTLPPDCGSRRVAQPLRARRRGLPAERGGLGGAAPRAGARRDRARARHRAPDPGRARAQAAEARLHGPRRLRRLRALQVGRRRLRRRRCRCPTGASCSRSPTSAARASRPRWSTSSLHTMVRATVDVQPSLAGARRARQPAPLRVAARRTRS